MEQVYSPGTAGFPLQAVLETEQSGQGRPRVLLKMGNFCAVWLELPKVGAAPHC